MIGSMLQTLRWGLSLGKKFALVVPFQTLCVVFLTLLSQMAALLATFLPLKVVILLGSEGIPRYFPESWAVLDRDFLIAWLCLGTLGVYLLHLLAERLIQVMTGWGARRLLQRSHKMVLFENQDELARDAYQRFSRALAAGVFVVLALAGLAVFYPAMVLVLTGYLSLMALVFWGLFTTSEAFRQSLESRLPATLNLGTGIGFFVGFGYLVADFLLWSPPNVIIGIVALLLSRQVMQKVSGLVGDLSSLQRNRVKLDALFFHGKVFMPALPHEQSGLWALLEPSARDAWVSEVLTEFTNWQGGPVIANWYQLGVPNMAALLIESDSGNYLIKLFAANRTAIARHEATVLAEPLLGLPAICFLGATQVQGLHCLVFEWLDYRSVDQQAAKRLQVAALSELMKSKPSVDLLQRYQRSRPMLWQRFRPQMLNRLKLAANNDDEKLNCARLTEQLPVLAAELQVMPVCIHTMDVGQYDLCMPVDGSSPRLLNWSRWSLEPIGAGWPTKPKLFDQLNEALALAKAKRPDLAAVTLAQAELAALSFALEVCCQRQRFSEALALVPALLERLEAVVISDNG